MARNTFNNNNPSARLWDWKLFLLILAYAVLPSIYSSYSLYLIGNELPSTAGLAIASQWQFVQVILEVVQEATVLPIFFFLGSKIGAHGEEILARLKTSITTIFSLVLILMAILWFKLDSFIDFSGTDQVLKALSREYLSIKIGASLFAILNMGIIIAIEALNKKRIFLYLIVLKAGGMILLDSFFFGGYSFSMGWGIKGAAYSNLIIEGLIFLIGFIILLRSFSTNFLQFFKLPWLIDFNLFRNIGLGSGVESLIKNIAYFMLIIKLINELGPQQISAYYLAMHIFWSFLLVPIMAGVETSRALISNHADAPDAVFQVARKAMMVGLVIVLGWLVLIPFWENILFFFSSDLEIVELSYTVLTYLIIPYILLSFNLLLDSLFYGLGKTQYMAYQSLITNGTVYLVAYILYYAGYWIPDFTAILILFGIGIVVDSFVTVFFARKVMLELKHEKTE